MSGQLVEQWPLKPLSEICEIKGRIGYRGYTRKDLVSEGEGAISLSPSNIIEQKLNFNKRTYISWEKYNESPEIIIENGDVVFCKTASVGKCAYIDYLPEKTTLNPQLVVLKKIKINPKFLYYYLSSEVFFKQLKPRIGGTAVPTVSQKIIGGCNVPIPPLEEQQRIVGILDEAVENISNSTQQINQKIHEVNTLFPSILKSLIPQGVNDCEEVLLGNTEYIQIIDGDRGVNYPKKSDFMNEGHCLFLNTKNVLRNGFNFDNTMFIDEEKDRLLRKGKLQRNDVILTTRGTLGNTAVYHEEIPFNHIRINSGMLIFRPNVEKIYPKYLYHLFTSDIVRLQISSHSRGAAQPHLPVKVLSTFTIPIPRSINSQKTIVKNLELLATEYDFLLQKLRKAVESFNELQQSILQEAFNGTL